MPKSVVVDPNRVRRVGVLKTPEIPLNQYVPDVQVEIARYGRDGLKRVYHDMLVIREFETMLDNIKRQGAHLGIEYNHAGPAHLSLGQEATAVGQALPLGVDDFIFGSHRSHGEILAKCLSAVDKLDDQALMHTMETYMDGAPLRAVEKGHQGSVKDLAIDYVLYGVLAEIFARENGFNRGLGGSMHAFFAPFGSMPNNAIVGGSADIAVGSALFKRVNRRPGIVVANIGDASSGCGPVWEGIMFSAMDQYRTLWDKEVGGSPPILFNFINNFYGMGGQPEGETMGFGILARLGAGVNAEAMHAERVDGYNPFAVADAVVRKKEILLEGRGPVLLDTVTYRISGHSPSDASSYRTKEEVALWLEADCIQYFGNYLQDNEVATSSDLDEVKGQISERIRKALTLATSDQISPRIDMSKGDPIGDVMFSNKRRDKMAEGEPEVLMPIEENPRVQANARKSRSAFDEMASRFQNQKCCHSATPFSKPSSTDSIPTRRWSPTVRKTATGAVLLPSTAASPKPCPITACSTHPSRKEQLWVRPSGTR